MRIALDDRYRDIAHRHLPGHEIVFYDLATPAAFLATAQDPHVLGCAGPARWRFEAQIIDALPRLQFIQKIGTGTDWFDIDAVSKRGILLANNAGLNAMSVADHLVTLLLMCLRGMLDPILGLRRGEWIFVPPKRIVEVEDATVGIVGFGRIGLQVARRLLAFGDVRVLAHQRRRLDPLTTPTGVRQATLDDLLRQCDAVVLCVPLTPETRGFIGARELARMPSGAVLVNGSRGGVLDEKALYDSLVSGHLCAAASDVFEEEPTPPHNPLLQLPNFIGTPHMAGRSRRNSPRQLEQALVNINRFLSGERPERLVNPEVLDALTS